MFEISREAEDVVRRIPEQPGQLPSAGLRIAAGADDEGPLSVRPALEPRRGDTVVERDGARVFLDRVAQARLQGRLLHVRTRPDGRLQFRVRTRPGAHGRRRTQVRTTG